MEEISQAISTATELTYQLLMDKNSQEAHGQKEISNESSLNKSGDVGGDL